MKKISLLLVVIATLVSCNKEHPTNFLSISGELKNNTDSLITILGNKGILKTISIKEDGTFKDTLKVEGAQIYTMQTSRSKRSPIFLKNGYDLKLVGDSNQFMKSFVFSGAGAPSNNFIISQIALSQKIGNPSIILALEKEAFEAKIGSLKKSFDSLLVGSKEIDSSLVSMSKQQNQRMFDYFEETYSANLKTRKGNPSPKFTDYVDFKGGKKSLDSFKGKYVYIDVWATWCGPCIKEIPALQKLEHDYKNKNIEFVSISTDEFRRSGGSWEKAEEKWRNFVEEKQMKGIQLWSGQDASFQSAYNITSIPRFILIDPKGVIVDPNAPRPSDPGLKEVFASLGI